MQIMSMELNQGETQITYACNVMENYEKNMIVFPKEKLNNSITGEAHPENI